MAFEANGKHSGCGPDLAQAYAGSSPVDRPFKPYERCLMAAKKALKPEPVAVETVCSVCGLDWGSHGENPTAEDCIRLLKVEAERPPIIIQEERKPYREPYRERPYWGESPGYPVLQKITYTNGSSPQALSF